MARRPTHRVASPVRPRGLHGLQGRAPRAGVALPDTRTPQAEEPRTVPRRAGDGAGDGGKASIGGIPKNTLEDNEWDDDASKREYEKIWAAIKSVCSDPRLRPLVGPMS